MLRFDITCHWFSDDIPLLSKRTALVHLARHGTDAIRAHRFSARAPDTNRCVIVPMTSFAIHEELWFHRHIYGSCKINFSHIDSPTIFVKFDVKLFLAQQTMNHPYLGKISIAPALKVNQILHNRPEKSQREVRARRATI